MRYLHETLNISWMSAQYYADFTYEFFWAHVEKKRKKLFDFSKVNIETLLLDLTTKMYLYVDATRFISILNAIYFFAGYLRRCNNFSIEEMHTTQEHCKSIFAEWYPKLKMEYTEARCFPEFPHRHLAHKLVT